MVKRARPPAKPRVKPAKPRAPRPLKAVEKVDVEVARAVALDEDSVMGLWIARFAELGDQPPLRVLCGATIAAGALRRDPQLVRTGLRMALAHSVATMAKAFVKDGVDRTRPSKALDSQQYEMKPGKSHEHDFQSMPSGHSAGVVAVAAAAIADYPAVKVPAIAGGGAILAAQLPSQNHFVSDIAVGSAIGLAAFGLALWLLPVSEHGDD